jgi:predicted RNA binding protein YcfA (HicA-like mRNA interferase family)
MSQWSSAKAKRVLAALFRIGWKIKRESSSHKVLFRPGWPDVVFASTIKMKLVQRCWRELRSIQGLNRQIFDSDFES